MAPKGMKDRELYLQCEWGICKTVIEDTVDEFIKHVKEHLQEFLHDNVDVAASEIQDEYECLWRDCGFSYTGAPADLIRHVFFHAYHTKVKWYGLQEQSKCKLNPCQLDMQNRNLIPELPELFQCAWQQCMYHVDNPEYFYRHVEMHAMTSDSAFIPEDCMDGYTCKWEGCRTSVKTKFKLREHLRSHTQEKRYGCFVCGGLFYNRTKFVDHLDRQLAVELQKFQCSHCSKTFSTERLLRDHMRCHVNHYKCPFCDMTCPSPSSLKAHIKFRHTEEKPHKCELCGYGCKSAYDLRRHMDSHNAAIVFKCEEKGCQYATKVTQSLRLHYKKVHNHVSGPRYLCHMCNSHFSRGGILTKHLKTKHKFKWPSGHSRFRYKLHEDGFHRLQTVRYESIELTEQLIKERQCVGGGRQDNTAVPETEAAMDDDEGILPSNEQQSIIGLQSVLQVGHSDVLHVQVNTQESINGSDLEQSIDGSHLHQQNIDGSHLHQQSIDGSHLQQQSIDGSHLQQQNIDGSHLQQQSIDGSHLHQQSIDGSHLHHQSIDGSHLQQQSIDRSHLQQQSIDGSHLQQQNIDGSHLQQQSIDASHLQQQHIDGSHLHQQSIDGSHLQQQSIDGSHLEQQNIHGCHSTLQANHPSDLQHMNITAQQNIEHCHKPLVDRSVQLNHNNSECIQSSEQQLGDECHSEHGTEQQIVGDEQIVGELYCGSESLEVITSPSINSSM
ncbi:histone H4 transcription factor-like [Glandiceps talaboti]